MGGRALVGARLLARKAAKEGAFPSQIKLQASGTCLERLRMPIYSTYNISQDAATWPLPAHLREIRMQLYSLSSCACQTLFEGGAPCFKGAVMGG